MTYKISFSCLFMAIVAFGFSGMASAKTNQTIAFSPASANISVGGTVIVTATSTSGLHVSLSQDSTTTNYCSFNRQTGLVTGKGVGMCKINASQGGNITYASAKAVLSIPVTQKLAQTIIFGAAPNITVGGTGTVIATASSGLSVTLTSKSPTICSFITNTNTLKGQTAGTCTIAADQVGDTKYLAAPEVTQSFSISQQTSNGGGNGGGGTKLAVTAPFDCATLASSGNAADDGRRAYIRLNCVSCHGQDASGGMGPNIQDESGDVGEAVNGEGAMPSYAGFLCPNDVVDLQAYLNSISKTTKFLDWDDQLEKIVSGTPAPAPTGVVPGP